MLIEEKFVQFISPFSMIVAGPSGSGKSILVRRIIKNHYMLITPQKEKRNVLWVYGQWQELYNQQIQNVQIEYIEGFPSED